MFIDIGYNIIVDLPYHCLCNETELGSLYLNNNVLETLHRRSFNNLPKLYLFNLSYNYLDYLLNNFIENSSKYKGIFYSW